MIKKIIRKLISVETKYYFLNIPASGIEMMPDSDGKISVEINGKNSKLSYSAKYNRIFGLSHWYKTYKPQVGDEVVFEKRRSKYILSVKDKSQKTTLDISGLSSQAKGNIVEDRVKELIVLHGQGLLNVYRPVTDTQGVDLIVTKSGLFQPIFLQVKGRFNVNKCNYFLMDINDKTLTPNEFFFVVGASFNPETMEIDDDILLIPSDKVKKSKLIEGKRRRVQTKLSSKKTGWGKYVIKKTDLATKLIEKFDESDESIESLKKR